MCPRVLHMYAACIRTCIRTIHTCTHTYVRMCTLHGLLVQYPARLTPSFHGSMARCLDCSAPIYSGALLRFVQPPRFPSSLVRRPPPLPLSAPHGVHLFVFSFTCYIMPRLTWFVCSFLRSFVLLSPRAARRFGDFNARQLLFSRLLSPSLSGSFRSSVPAPTRARILARSSLFRGSVPSPFPIRRVSTVNRYFRSDAFRLSTVIPLSWHVKWICDSAFLDEFFFQAVCKVFCKFTIKI